MKGHQLYIHICVDEDLFKEEYMRGLALYHISTIAVSELPFDSIKDHKPVPIL